MNANVSYASIIKAYRRETGLSQERCAELFGVETSTFSRWERGVVTPGPAAQARIVETVRPRCGIDAQVRQIIRSTPCLMQLILPTTEILAVSPAYEAFARAPASEIVGKFEIEDIGEKVLAEFELAGGIQRVLEEAECSAGSDIWRANDYSNLSGETLHLYFSAQRIFLDDGRPAVLETSVILSGDDAYRPLVIRSPRAGAGLSAQTAF